MLLLIAHSMCFSPFPVVKGADESAGDKPFFGPADAEAWCRRFLSFTLPAHSAELLGNLQNDGFMFERDGRWGAHWTKIRQVATAKGKKFSFDLCRFLQWHDKTFGSNALKTPREGSSSSVTRLSSSSKMSLRGKMGTSRTSVSNIASLGGGPESPPRAGEPPPVSPPAT